MGLRRVTKPCCIVYILKRFPERNFFFPLRDVCSKPDDIRHHLFSRFSTTLYIGGVFVVRCCIRIPINAIMRNRVDSTVRMKKSSVWNIKAGGKRRRRRVISHQHHFDSSIYVYRRMTGATQYWKSQLIWSLYCYAFSFLMTSQGDTQSQPYRSSKESLIHLPPQVFFNESMSRSHPRRPPVKRFHSNEYVRQELSSLL